MSRAVAPDSVTELRASDGTNLGAFSVGATPRGRKPAPDDVRKRTARRFRLASTSGVRFRYGRQKEAARGCGGRRVLWEFNRFLPKKPCQTGALAKTLLLRLIDVELHNHSASSYRRRHPLFKGAVRRLVSIHALASAAPRAFPRTTAADAGAEHRLKKHK